MHKQQLALDPNANLNLPAASSTAAAAAAVVPAATPTHGVAPAQLTTIPMNHHPPHVSLVKVPAVGTPAIATQVPMVGLPASHPVGLFPPQTALATKMKGGTTLMQAAIKKDGTKFTPY